MAQQYRRYAPNPQYNPLYAVDNAGKAADAARKEIQQMRDFYQSRRVVDQQTIEDARFAGQDLQALASLTESGASYFKQLAKQTAEDKEVGATWDAYNKGIEDHTVLTETQAEATAETQDEIVAATREGVDPATALKLENARKMGRGFQGEKAALQHGRNSYASYMTNYLAGDNFVLYEGEYVQAGQLLAEGGIDYEDKLNAVIQQARFDFIKTNKFHYATKKNFVKILGPTMDAVEQNLRLSKSTAASAQYQKDQSAKQEALLVDAISRVRGLRTRKDLQTVFNEAAEGFRLNNTGKSRREANSLIVKRMVQTFIANDTPENIEVLKTVLQRPGEEKTALGKMYGDVFLEAEIEASNQEKQRDSMLADRIETRYKQKLAQPGLSQPQRLAEINKMLKDLEGLNSKEGYDRAERLRGNIGTMVLDPDSAVNDARLDFMIQKGDLPDYETTINGGRMGKYSPEAIKRFEAAHSQKTKAASPPVKETYKGFQDAIDRRVETTLGLKKDEQGTYRLVKRLLPYVDYSTATMLSTAIGRDLAIERDRILRNSLETDPVKLANELDKGLQAWEKANFRTAGGKYYLNGFWEATRDEITNNITAEKKFKPAFDYFKESKFRTAPSTLPQDISNAYSMAYPMPAEIALDYSPTRGDILFDNEQLENYRVAWDSGIIDPDLVNVSDSLNMSPLDVMNYELAAHRQAPYTPQIDTASISGAKQGAHAFELAGFPSRSAGFMAAAISYTTDWRDPQSLQLEQWAEQMRLENPRAYRLLMAPGSSPRHMQQAMNELAGMELPDLSALAQYLTA